MPYSLTSNFRDHLHRCQQHLLPQRLLTALTYRITRSRVPWVKNTLINLFIRHFRVNMAEAAQPNPQFYPHFNAFFTRALKTKARPVVADKRVICSPVDGTVSAIGNIDGDTLLQAKGRTYSLSALLGGAEPAQAFHGGTFATLYLSPADYHRIHLPLDGQLRAMRHIPGQLFSVSPQTVRSIDQVFARNERVVTYFDTPAGPMALILVGAINVASMETVWAGTITPPLGKTIQDWDYPQRGAGAVHLAKGAEMGRFNMGSTVIVLFAAAQVRWEREIVAGLRVRMGQRLGKLNPLQRG